MPRITTFTVGSVLRKYYPDEQQLPLKPKEIPVVSVQQSQQMPMSFEELAKIARNNGRIRDVDNRTECVVTSVDRERMYKMSNSDSIYEDL